MTLKLLTYPHGNAKGDHAKSHAYVCTQPHVLHDIRQQASTSSAPPRARAVYQDMVMAQPNALQQELPRDMEQVGCCDYVIPYRRRSRGGPWGWTPTKIWLWDLLWLGPPKVKLK